MLRVAFRIRLWCPCFLQRVPSDGGSGWNGFALGRTTCMGVCSKHSSVHVAAVKDTIKNMKIYVLLGAPGAGKGTVAAKIAKRTSAKHISTGALLRDAIKSQTPVGILAKSYMDKGSLVPDEVLVGIIDELLESAAADDVLLFDGFPRTENQAEQLDILAAKHQAEIKGAICLDVPEQVTLKRLGGRRVCPSCGMGYHVDGMAPKQEGICDGCGTALITRADDKPETIAHRLKVYEAETAPLIAKYREAGKLWLIDGSDGSERASVKILAAMNE